MARGGDYPPSGNNPNQCVPCATALTFGPIPLVSSNPFPLGRWAPAMKNSERFTAIVDSQIAHGCDAFAIFAARFIGRLQGNADRKAISFSEIVKLAEESQQVKANAKDQTLDQHAD